MPMNWQDTGMRTRDGVRVLAKWDNARLAAIRRDDRRNTALVILLGLAMLAVGLLLIMRTPGIDADRPHPAPPAPSTRCYALGPGQQAEGFRCP